MVWDYISERAETAITPSFADLVHKWLHFGLVVLLTCVTYVCYSYWPLRKSGLPRYSVGKESTCNAGDLGSIPGLGSSPGERKGYPLQYSGLENSMGCIAHGITKSGHNWATFTFKEKWKYRFYIGAWYMCENGRWQVYKSEWNPNKKGLHCL